MKEVEFTNKCGHDSTLRFSDSADEKHINLVISRAEKNNCIVCQKLELVDWNVEIGFKPLEHSDFESRIYAEELRWFFVSNLKRYLDAFFGFEQNKKEIVNEINHLKNNVEIEKIFGFKVDFMEITDASFWLDTFLEKRSDVYLYLSSVFQKPSKVKCEPDYDGDDQ